MKITHFLPLLGLALTANAWAQEKADPVRVTLVRWPYT